MVSMHTVVCRIINFLLKPVGMLVVVLMLDSPAFCTVNYGEGVSASFLYKLSDFSGTVPFSWVRMSVDTGRREIYVTDEDYAVRVFNDAGMEIYRFNEDGALGSVRDVAVNKEGNILVLSYAVSPPGKYSIIRCNYRGDPLANLELTNIPPEFSRGFVPGTLAYREGRIYATDKSSMKVLVTDEQGLFEQAIDLFALTGLDEKKRRDYEIMGFSVDREGNILFTVPVMFRAFKLAPDRTLASFGERGGAPGKFNVAAGIVSDDKGYYYVADRLKSVVMIYDRNFNFLDQVGYRGFAAGNLIVPTDMAVLGDKLYVTQAAGRGVSVFSIKHRTAPITTNGEGG